MSEEKDKVEDKEQEKSSSPNIPEKFKGKSVDEIIESYLQLESKLGLQGKELGELQRERDELIQNQLRLQQAQMQAQNQNQKQVDFDSLFEENPKEAIKAALTQVQEYTKNAYQQLQYQSASRYLSEKYQNPDFVRRLPIMQRILQQHQHIFNPAAQLTPETIDFLDNASKAYDMDYYINQAVEQAKSKKETTRNEKLSAHSEGASGSNIQQEKDYDSMSLEDLKKLIGVVRR